jgi:hypothetical protein
MRRQALSGSKALMDWKTAAPYVAAAVALCVGLVSALLSTRNARRTLETQRALSREERLWEKRAEAYVDLIAWCSAALETAEVLRRTVNRGVTMKPDKWTSLTQVPADLGARVTAFGSDEVDRILNKIRKATYDLIDLKTVPARRTPEGKLTYATPEGKVPFERLEELAQLTAWSDSLEELRTIIRAELQQVGRPRSTSRPDGPRAAG